MTPSEQIYSRLSEDEKAVIISIGIYVAMHLARTNTSHDTFMRVMDEQFPLINKKDLN